MKKEYYIYGGCILVLVFSIVCVVKSNKSKANYTNVAALESMLESDNEEDADLEEDKKSSNVKNIHPDTDPKSKTVLVNKEFLIDKNYKPDDLVVPNVGFSFNYEDEKKQLRKEAAEALEDMFEAAKREGCVLLATSGFRSYGRQVTLYNYNLVQKGYDYTNVYSAKPGASEHQTGWSMDITANSVNGKLTVEFANTKEGKWAANNCYKFGFVLRYPKDKEKITAYGYEPWHFRYVGCELAKELTEKGITLDEYYGYVPDNMFIEKEQMAYYDELLNNKKKQVTSVTEAEMDDLSENTGDDKNNQSTLKPTDTMRDVTENPMYNSTIEPTSSPTVSPTVSPTIKPTIEPTIKPTVNPTVEPTVNPTVVPTLESTGEPLEESTQQPTE